MTEEDGRNRVGSRQMNAHTMKALMGQPEGEEKKKKFKLFIIDQ